MDVLGDMAVEIENSLNKGLYTEIKTPEPITAEQIAAVEDRMHELVEADLPIVREVYTREEAVEIWGAYNYPEKSRLLEHAPDVETAKFYTLEGYRNFFYGLMTPSTGYIEHFELRKYRRGVLAFLIHLIRTGSRNLRMIKSFMRLLEKRISGIICWISFI